MYLINSSTLYLHYNGVNTRIVEDNDSWEVGGKLLNKILDASCIYYGSSFKGRIKGAQSLLKASYKVPIVISEKNNILFFPIKVDDNTWWINFNQIKEYKKEEDNMVITFNNGEILKVMVSATTFNNLLLKCSRLWLIYLTRK